MKIIKKRSSLDFMKNHASVECINQAEKNIEKLEQYQSKELQLKEHQLKEYLQFDKPDSSQQHNLIIFSAEISVISSLLRWLAVCSLLMLSALWVSA